MKRIGWGIIGCGDVTEIKSGPAFNKVNGSALVAVMRRDANKAKDYAERHGVPRWYDDAAKLIADPEVNAVYIATPPAFHEMYCLQAIETGKPVYVEKPMALNYAAALNMARAASAKKIKLSVAHYRRQLPFFRKIRALIAEQAIGRILSVRINFSRQPLKAEELAIPKTAWRVDPFISGGGLFHDLAPHQLDIMAYYFGQAKEAQGISLNQANRYTAVDIVSGNILFTNGILCSGTWCFNAFEPVDECEIMGENGKITFSFFDNRSITLKTREGAKIFNFELLQHIQQPMIEQVTRYFSGIGPNPCSGEEGAEVMRLIEAFTGKR